VNETNSEGKDLPFEEREQEFQNDVPADGRGREEILESMLEQTKGQLDSEGLHEKLTEWVRDKRLSSSFDFENVSELVRCILHMTKINSLSLDFEDCVNWIATCLYEDPLANERLERLWNSIVAKLQG